MKQRTARLARLVILALCFSLGITGPVLAANTGISDSGGNSYTLDQPYLYCQILSTEQGLMTQYILEAGTTITAPEGTAFTAWSSRDYGSSDTEEGSLTEPASQIKPEPGREYVYGTDAGTWLYVAVPVEGVFVDVALEDWFYEPVRWAVETGVTTGTAAYQFQPGKVCTQGEILTFLWRASGSPEPAGENPFQNPTITPEAYFYKAMVWAWEQGILTEDSQSPEDACSRSDVAVYLWRLAGETEVSTTLSFTDVPQDASYAKAVSWAVEQGITQGTSAALFSPNTPCTRGHIVTFLYRYFGV